MGGGLIVRGGALGVLERLCLCRLDVCCWGALAVTSGKVRPLGVVPWVLGGGGSQQ